MTITYHPDVVQGSEEWVAMRCGLITASEMHLLLTPTLRRADNDKQRAHLYELAAQRITQHVEPHYVSEDMLRGHTDEVEARILYAEHYAPVREVGFVTNDSFGFTLGCSPDGLVGDDGQIEIKSRRQKCQIETILGLGVPAGYMPQIQTALLVTGRAWLDFISYSGGLPMVVCKVRPDAEIQAAILEAAGAAEKAISKMVADFKVKSRGLIPTERRVEQEMVV